MFVHQLQRVYFTRSRDQGISKGTPEQQTPSAMSLWQLSMLAPKKANAAAAGGGEWVGMADRNSLI
jgi:hypothetical protein